MPKKKKRKYTFKKGQVFPYESGSIIHEMVKSEKEIAKTFSSASKPPKKLKRKRF